ncbi:MAG TPA: trypsin-like serine protease [Tepidisphaeraceae bacterium]|jgi:hypothetical protein|nr:trypsin-like serine protease [Tepidisphaeraceae bacterium]
MRNRLMFLLAATLFPAVSNAALHIDGYTPARHDRFANSPSFIGAGYDFSGVGHAGGSWATMISPSYFLTAAHASPAVNSTATFDADNVPGGTVSYTVASAVTLKNPDGSNSDLRLGRLTTPLNPLHNIATYAIPLLGDNSAYIGRSQFVYGRGNAGDTSDRVGRNTIDEIIPPNPNDNFDVGGVEGYATISYYDDGSGIDETFLQGGDSGAPNFIDVGGQLTLVGINWFNATDDKTKEWVASGGSFVPAYAQQIADAMVGESFVAVPEPGVVGVLVVALGVGVMLRRRRVAT